ncbi:MAG TPA: hypothetical protein VJH71_01205 [Candidatus Paceibacterota bacterium]
MLNVIPVVGWILDIFFKASLAVPFWFIWTVCGFGKRYFYFVPPVYQDLPFFHCLGLFIVIPIIYIIVVPKIISVSQNNDHAGEKSKKTQGGAGLNSKPEEEDYPKIFSSRRPRQ